MEDPTNGTDEKKKSHEKVTDYKSEMSNVKMKKGKLDGRYEIEERLTIARLGFLLRNRHCKTLTLVSSGKLFIAR